MRIVQKLGLLAAFVTLVGCNEALTDPVSSPGDGEASSASALAASGHQDCSIVEHDVIIKTPADLKAYGETSCFSIHGSLVVRNTTGVVNLDDLHGLRFVRDGVAIGKNTRLKNINGLRHLEYVGQTFVVEGNKQLRSLKVPRLAYVEENFHVFNNAMLTRLRAPKLESVGAQFIIATSPIGHLKFPQLAFVGDDFIIEHMPTMRTAKFPALERLSGLARIEVNNKLRRFEAKNLMSVESTLEFLLNDKLTKIRMDALDYIGGPLNFLDNSSLSTCEIQGLVDSVGIYDIGARPYATRNGGGKCELNFDATPECRIIEGDVVIKTHADLKEFAGEECLSIRGGLFIRDTVDIEHLRAFRGLRFVSEWVSIAKNQSLKSLNALKNLRFIGFGLVVEENPKLFRANLPRLKVIGTVLHVFDQPTLRSLRLKALEVIGDQWVIGGVDDLRNVDTSALKWLGAQVNIENNDRLRRVRLDSLEHAIGSVRVRYNHKLKEMKAPKLRHIGQSLQIQRNLDMESIALPALDFVARDLFIDYNPLIDQCDVYGLVGQIGFYDIGGRVRIFQHDPGACGNFMEGQAGPIGQMPVWNDFVK